MGKVRDYIPNNGEGLAQWVYRKLKNHDPLSARDSKGKRVDGKKRCEYVEGSTQAIYRLNNGETYCVTVERIE